MRIDVVPVADAGLGNSAYLVDLGDGGALLVDPHRVIAPYERAIATPGHTPEHLAYLLLDGATPIALFSGGTLIAGGVARPDLIAAEQTERLARAAHRSIVQRVLTLPDDLPVYPTHGGGSFCSAGTGGRVTTTIGHERAANPLLQVADEDAFVARLLGGLGSFHPYFLHLREVNRTGPTVYGRDLPRLRPLTAREVVDAVDGGAVLVDARPIDRFAAGHVSGSVSIELRSQFATWLGWVVPFGTPIVVNIDDDQHERDLVAQALTIGYEWDAGHVPDALHRELGTLRSNAADLPDGLVVHCGHGQRAMTAASLLLRAGHRDVTVTTAGPDQLATTIAAGAA